MLPPRRLREVAEMYPENRLVHLNGIKPRMSHWEAQGWSLLWCSRVPSRLGCAWDLWMVKGEMREVA